jgi:NAD(P)-dependent dehydrogenase (short-subunit alcohol dehydrogenase family)
MKDTQNHLEDKAVVITGPTRGFGDSLAQELLRAGAKVVVSGRSQATTPRQAQPRLNTR